MVRAPFLALSLIAAGLVGGAALADPRAGALPGTVRALVPDARWTLAGEGRLSKFFIHVYDAQLWTVGDRWSPDTPFALAITYARAVDADQLAALTRAELMRLGAWDAAGTAAWDAALVRAFPDVRPGDQLVGVHLPGQPVRFFLNGAFHSELAEPRLAAVFFDLWLDPRTSEPALRRRLLGEG